MSSKRFLSLTKLRIRNGQLVQQGAFADLDRKRLTSRTTIIYDDKKTPPSSVPASYFKGFSQAKTSIQTHNVLRITRLNFDQNGAITKRVDGTGIYEHNTEGYPLKLTYREFDKTLNKDTGDSQEVTYIYDCK